MPVADDDAALVLATRAGDQAAFSALFERWSDRCFDVARRIVHDDGKAAEVVQDTFLVAWRQLDTLRDPAAFGGWVLRTSRNKALNRLERDGRSVSVAGDAPVLLGRTDGTTAADDVEREMTAAELQDLVVAATVVLGERDASVLDLHLRHGLGAPEIAEELGVTANNAHQLLFRMKRNLTAGIRAWVLVRGGRPSCVGLAAALDLAGIESFGREAARVIDAHVEDCDDCARRQAAMLDPAALFAAAPVVVLAPALRASIVDGLRSSGVPVDGPEAGTTGGGSGEPPTAAVPVAAGAPFAASMIDGPDEELTDPHRRRRRGVLIAIAAVLLLLALIAGVGALDADGEGDTVAAVDTTIDPSVGSTTAPENEPDGSTSTTTGGTTTSGVLPAPAPTTTLTPGATTTVVAPSPTQPPSPAPEQPPSATLVPNPTSPTTTIAPKPPTTTTTIGPPTVDSFTATLAGAPDGPCSPGQWATTLAWTTTRATSVQISATTVTTISGLAADGSRIVCRPTYGAPPGGWKLKATGPGGSTTASA